MAGDKSQKKGTDPVENGVHNSEDVEMGDSGVNGSKQDHDGDEEMTVVVPPSKSSRLSGEPDKIPGDVEMGGAEGEEATSAEEVDPKTKALSGKRCQFAPEPCCIGTD